MSSLDELSRLAQRYHLKRTRSSSSVGSSSSSSSSSGYASILSDDNAQASIHQSPNHSRAIDYHLDDALDNTPSGPKDLKLDMNNKGMKLLLKMGWVQGNGLGVSQNGRRDPVPTPAQTPLLGLGKATQDAYMLSNAISKPKELESLIIAREDEQAKVKREEKAKEIQTRVVERDDRLKTFHCQTCDKGYTTISQFEEHERSYAHHHAKRALEAKEARKATGRSTEAKLEKERKREAKELERMARAAGMSLDSLRPSASIPKAEGTKSNSIEAFKKPCSGWTKLAPSSSTLTTNKVESLKSSVVGSESEVVDRNPVNSNFHQKIIDHNHVTTSASNKFKSSGFAPISPSVSSLPSSGFKPIGRTSTEPNQMNLPPPSTSSTSRFTAPKFITGSTLKEGGQSQNRIESQTTDDQTKNPTPVTNSTPAPSKFAQIAARLAARKANSSTPSSRSPSAHRVVNDRTGSSTGHTNLSTTTSLNDQYNSEIEKLLDI